MPSTIVRLFTLGVALIVVLAACGEPSDPSTPTMTQDQFQSMLLDMSDVLTNDEVAGGLTVVGGFWGEILLDSGFFILSSDHVREGMLGLAASEFPYAGPVLPPVFGVAPLMILEEDGDPALATGTYLYPVSGTDTYTPNEAGESFLRSTTEVRAGEFVDDGEVMATLTYDDTRDVTFRIADEDVTSEAPTVMSFELSENVFQDGDSTRIAATARQSWVTNTCGTNEVDSVTLEDVTFDLSTPPLTVSGTDEIPAIDVTLTMPQAGIAFRETGIELDGNASFSLDTEGLDPLSITSSGEIKIAGSKDRGEDCYPNYTDVNGGSGSLTIDVAGVVVELRATIALNEDGSVTVSDGQLTHDGRFVVISGTVDPEDDIVEVLEVLNVTFVDGETKTLAEAIDAINVVDVTLNRFNVR